MGIQREEGELFSYYDDLRHFLHDLAQPLATVAGLVDLLLLDLDERDRVFQEIQLISQQLEKVMYIIGEIRQLAREAAERAGKDLPAPRTNKFS